MTTADNAAPPTRPLSGIRVVGLEQYMAGPYCTMLLADAGAEVIKIERPGTGDPRRSIPPFAEKDGRRKAAGFMGYNRNKKSLALNLRDPRGQDVFRKLAATADVVVENLRPGSMTRQGLGHREMRAVSPRLVWAIISGFGRLDGFRGPYSDRPAFDIVAEAMGGVMNSVGFADKPPSWTIYGMADVYTGMVTAYGIMQALFMRERTGEGQLVDSAMFDNMLSLNETMVTLYSVAGQVSERGKLRNYWPRGAFETRDGFIAINVPDEIVWRRVCEIMERPDLIEDARTSSGPARAENVDFVQPILEAWLKALTRDEAVAKFNDAGVPCGPVYDAEDVFDDPHVAARGMLMPVADPDVGEYRLARTPLHLSACPTLPAQGAPRLGQHTSEILQDLLGYGADDVETLAGDNVIQLDEADG